jgi:uncharacterized protein (DUF924 family)
VSAPPARAGEILDFWFGAPGDPGRGGFRGLWFERSDAFDAEIRRRFLADVEDAASGARDAWAATPAGALALLILLDQFPRNLFRGDPRAFATDARARAIAAAALEAGHDRALGPVERVFLCLPFEHSEDLADQDRSVALFEAIPEGGGYTAEVRAMAIRAARSHREIVARFGRFPHRNAALGRATTEEEAAFLREPNSSF